MGQETHNSRLQELIEGVDVSRVLNGANPVITSLADDSRSVTPGAVFVAVRGHGTDGHEYLSHAIQAGASAIICESLPSPVPDCPVIQVADSRRALSALADRFHGSPSRKLRVTGVTGTDGKTSTVELLRTILTEAGSPAASIGTLGYFIDGQWVDSDLTTPGPVELHSSFRRMLQFGLTDACMEVSSHSLMQHRVADVAFDAGVLTNITQDHLDYHGTRENYARAKRILFESLRPDSVAVLPAESEFYQAFQEHTDAEVLTYSTESLADVRGRIVSLAMDGMEIRVRTPAESYGIRTSLTGSYNCLNILAAATVAFGFGIGGEVVKEALRGFRGVPGRLERVRVPGRHDLPAVCVDYAHTPAALKKVLEVLRPLVKGKLICVVGCGGDRDKTKRPLMGDIAADGADLTVFTADNSRSEPTEDIIAQMVAGIRSPIADFRTEPDRRKAMELAIAMAPSPNSMVVICGRGCERYQKIAGRSIPFDDRYVAREIMEQLPARHRRTA
ncbi:MAG: UDP-N-acetylmuramoyl-L-alanyl-D-glutamate--2,6-diaminopimelate ligase [Planctomycetota bacterium]|jgi:UDP-N-acetylmuramoyl-L-alanyl-D-glutamate--2,6-diaminopimelate ligase